MDSNTYLPRLHGKHNLANMLQQFDWLSLYISYIEAYEFWVSNPGVAITKLVPDIENILPSLTGHLAIDEILSCILHNPETDLRQKVVADRFFLNQSYLSTLFHAKTGELFSDYIQVVKILRARYLVRHTSMLIGTLA